MAGAGWPRRGRPAEVAEVAWSPPPLGASPWGGCYRLAHYDYPNKGGDRYDTTGVGQTDNLSAAMNNRTESVAYHGS